MKIISIKDIIAYRLKKETSIVVGEEVELPTEYGMFHLIPFRQANGLEHMALIKVHGKKTNLYSYACTHHVQRVTSLVVSVVIVANNFIRRWR